MLKRVLLPEKRVIRILIIIFGLTITLISLIGDKGYLELRELKLTEANLEAEIIELEANKLEWSEKIQAIKQNPDYIETFAREKFGFVKRDEIVLEIKIR